MIFFSFFFSEDLSSTKCEEAENQASFAQPVIVQPEIDIEVSEVCFVISISKCGWDSGWKKDAAYHEHTVQKKKSKKILFSPPYSNLYQFSMTVFMCGITATLFSFLSFLCVKNSSTSMLSRHSNSESLDVVTVCVRQYTVTYRS